MSTYNLAKNLKPATKACNTFKNHLQSKLLHPKFRKTIKILRQRFRVSYQSTISFIHKNFRTLTKRPPPPHSLHHHRHHSSFPAIYLDQLFPKNMAEQQPSNINISINKASARPGLAIANHDKEVKTQMQHVDKEGAKGKTKAGDSKSSADHDNWKMRPLLLPQFRGIDERAEEFIAKFREDMKLEREQSILEFEEMLKRSA